MSSVTGKEIYPGHSRNKDSSTYVTVADLKRKTATKLNRTGDSMTGALNIATSNDHAFTVSDSTGTNVLIDANTNTSTLTLNTSTINTNNLLLTNKLSISTGSNKTVGTATLVAGSITVNNTSVTSSSLIFVSRTTSAGTIGHLSCPIASIVNNTSFVINSSSATDTSTINYWIIN